ncbi:hypothetical protein VTN02DRAFT_4633 [Thermoascus thermophilus]
MHMVSGGEEGRIAGQQSAPEGVFYKPEALLHTLVECSVHIRPAELTELISFLQITGSAIDGGLLPHTPTVHLVVLLPCRVLCTSVHLQRHSCMHTCFMPHRHCPFRVRPGLSYHVSSIYLSDLDNSSNRSRSTGRGRPPAAALPQTWLADAPLGYINRAS